MILFGGGVHSGHPEPVDNILSYTKSGIASNETVLELGNLKLVAGNRHDTKNMHSIIKLGNGCIFGFLFEKKTNAKVKSLSQDVINKIIESDGKYLGSNYWGQYVVILQDPKTGDVFAFPDPMGYTSIFYARHRACVLISSDLWCIKDTMGNDATFNVEHFYSLFFSNLNQLLNSTHTPFQEIFEVENGFGLKISHGKISFVQIWNPFEITGAFSHEEIMPTFLKTVQALSDHEFDISVSLSGGLDSSSMLMSLAHVTDNKDKISAFTWGVDEVASSSEYYHAKRVTDFCGVQLTKVGDGTPWKKIGQKTSQRADRPSFTYIVDRIWDGDYGIRAGKTVVFDGHGGDQIFCEGTQEKALGDYFLDNGLSGIVGNAKKLTRLSRKSLFFFLKNALSGLYQYYTKGFDPLKYYDFKTHEWFKGSIDKSVYKKLLMPMFMRNYKGCPPAKLAHILSIFVGPFQSKIHNKDTGVPVLYPYYSQPMVELCLKMPIYDSYDECNSRLPFRKAVSEFFKTDLPFRKSKGETSGVLQIGLQQNIKRIKELLLEGYFARNHLVDRNKMQDFIHKVAHGMTEHMHPFAALLTSELWLESWDIK